MAKTLVAYFSRAGMNYAAGNIKNLERGNGQVLAEYAAAACGGELFEIRPASAYPADYRECVSVATEEKRANARPELADDCDPAAYEHVVLVYPNWCGTMPMPVYAWLESHNFAGKSIWPLCTHEGSGMSGTEGDIAGACPGAVVERGLAVLGHKASNAKPQVEAWLEPLQG